MSETILDEVCLRNPVLAGLRGDVIAAAGVLSRCWQQGGTLFLAGNGGSRCDAEHMAGELLKGFHRRRPLEASQQEWLRGQFGDDGAFLGQGLQGGLRAIVLGSADGLASAVANDNHADLVYAQHLYSLARPGDVLLAISTSGNARNVLLACMTARLRRLTVIGMTGQTGGSLRQACDICLRVPARETYLVQELHLPLYHCLCAMVEAEFFAV